MRQDRQRYTSETQAAWQVEVTYGGKGAARRSGICCQARGSWRVIYEPGLEGCAAIPVEKRKKKALPVEEPA